MHIDFSSSQRTSLGVEWELELVDLDTRQLTAGADEILIAISPNGDGVHPKAKHELLQSCVEVITGICQTVAEARADLAETVAQVAKAAEPRNLGVMCSGTHPMTDWATQRITADERYATLVERNQWMARQLQIFGIHVHCGIRSPDKAIPILNGLLAYVPHFWPFPPPARIGSARIPGWRLIAARYSRRCPPPACPFQLSGWDAFEKYMDALISSQAIQSIREVWWDIRPHPGFGTVELRICDGLPTLDEIACVAALSQCLVERFDRQLDYGYTCPSRDRGWSERTSGEPPDTGWTREIVVDNTGRVQPLTTAITDLVEDLLPIARRLDCSEELEAIPRLMDRGCELPPAARRCGGEQR